MKNQLIKNLNRYNYKFEEDGNKVVIDMETWQTITVIFENEKVIIEDRLKSWNILTTFPMKIKTALFLNPIFVLIFVTLFINFEESYKMTGLLIAINILIVTFSVYYLIKLEGMKTKIAIWLAED